MNGTNEKPLNPRVKIRPNGRPYVELADLVKERLARIEREHPRFELALPPDESVIELPQTQVIGPTSKE